MNPQRVIDGLVAHGALELAPTVADLKMMLSSRDLKVSGKKADLIQRLLEADPKGLEVRYAHRMNLRCTPAASQAVAGWKVECTKAFEMAAGNVIAALRNRHFKEAIRTADTYRKNKFETPLPPGAAAMTIKSAPRSIEERAKELAMYFYHAPENSGGTSARAMGRSISQPRSLAVARAGSTRKVFAWICQHWSHRLDRFDQWRGDELQWDDGNDSHDCNANAKFLCHAPTRSCTIRELGIKKATINGIGGCEACSALYNKTYSIDTLPELPYEDCTCALGCRCWVRTVLPF